MATLLLLLTTAHGPAGPYGPGGPSIGGPYPPPRRTLCDRFLDGYRQYGLVVSGAACSYKRRVPVSNGPTPFYARYLEGSPYPWMSEPAPAPAAPPGKKDADEGDRPRP